MLCAGWSSLTHPKLYGPSEYHDNRRVQRADPTHSKTYIHCHETESGAYAHSTCGQGASNSPKTRISLFAGLEPTQDAFANPARKWSGPCQRTWTTPRAALVYIPPRDGSDLSFPTIVDKFSSCQNGGRAVHQVGDTKSQAAKRTGIRNSERCCSTVRVNGSLTEDVLTCHQFVCNDS